MVLMSTSSSARRRHPSTPSISATRSAWWTSGASQPRRTPGFQAVNGLRLSAREYHALAGFAIDNDILINGGMFICAPQIHGAMFRELVAQYIEIQRGHPRGAQYEQAMLSFELQTRGLAHFLPSRGIAFGRIIGRTVQWGGPTPDTMREIVGPISSAFARYSIRISGAHDRRARS